MTKVWVSFICHFISVTKTGLYQLFIQLINSGAFDAYSVSAAFSLSS